MASSIWNLQLDHQSDPVCAVLLKFLERIARDRPYGVTIEVNSQIHPRELVPHEAVQSGGWQTVSGPVATFDCEVEKYSVYVDASRSSTLIRVAAAEAGRAESIANRIRELTALADDGEIEVTIWSYSDDGGNRSIRSLAVRSWSEVSRNYNAHSHAQVELLINRGRPDLDGGRLILFHGEPGTGKTNAIRALMHGWRDWCSPHLISDPDKMFADARYLMNVLQASQRKREFSSDNPSVQDRWKLIIAEDADSYLRSTARRDAGDAMGRLLNATDGLLGQSLPVLVLLTTNEPLTRLHPALIRPGRCLAEIEFGRLDTRESKEWLGDAAEAPLTDSTIAELYELLKSGSRPKGESRIGAYL